MPKKVIHIIFNLARGGAETMLVQDVNALTEYEQMIVTLQPDNHFIAELKNPQIVCLNCPSPFDIFKAILRFKRIIKSWEPDLVHSHLILPNFVARCAVPKSIPLITTIHNSLSHDFDYKRWRIRFLDRFTFSLRKSIIIGVSKIALKEYVDFLKREPFRKYVLYTFVNEAKIKPKVVGSAEITDVRAIAVGALRPQKNFEFLLNKFASLNQREVTLDIYGEGPLRVDLQKNIDLYNLPVTLKGQTADIETLIPLYDFCISASWFEGFSLAILEMMAAKVPLLLHNIGSFKEQCGDTALYFELDKEGDFEEKFYLIKNDKKLRGNLAEAAYKRVIENFTFTIHLKKLREIYIQALSSI